MPNITDQGFFTDDFVVDDKKIAASFQRIGSAATKAFEDIAAAVGKTVNPFRKFEADLGNVERKANSFGASIGKLGSSIGSAATRVGAGVGAIAGGGALLVAGALRVTTALRSIRESILEQRLASSQNAAQTKQSIQTDFSHANALEDLRRQYTQGKISIEDYTSQLRDLQFAKRREIAQTKQLRIEQEEIRKEQAADQAAAQRRAQQIRLEAQFGGVLASTLERLAFVLDNVRNRFLSAFGPEIAGFILNIGTTLASNTDKFIALFQNMAKGISASFARSGVTTEKVLTGLVNVATEFVKVITTVVVPAIGLVVKALQGIADLINNVFGTNFSAASLIAVAIVLKLTGLFKLLAVAIGFAVAGVRLLWAAFGPLGIVIGVLVAVIGTQLIPFLASIDWAGIATRAQAAWKAVVDVFNAAVGAIKQGWADITGFFSEQINSIIGFFDKLIKKVKEFLGLTGGTGSLSKDAGIDDIGKFAGGGLFRGRAGVDRNLAMLTDQEYIVKAPAVRHWGVGFLNAINNMRNLPGFNTGGLFNALSPGYHTPIPAFARGGQNNMQRPFVLKMPDGEEFSGMTIQDKTVDNMTGYARKRAARSAGPKPVWYGGTRR